MGGVNFEQIVGFLGGFGDDFRGRDGVSFRHFEGLEGLNGNDVWIGMIF